MGKLKFTVFFSVLAAVVVHAQDEDIPYVLESMSYVTVGEYAAGGGNVVDTSATTDGQLNAISHETFAAEVAQAHAEGTGGVIDFEVDLPGNTLRAIDRTLIAGYTRPAIDDGTDPLDARLPLLDNLSVGLGDDPYAGTLAGLEGADEALWYDPGSDPVENIVVPESVIGYAFAPEEGSSDIQVNPAESDPSGFLLVDPLRVIRVQDRRDRQNIEDDLLPINRGLNPIYATLRGIYGLGNENAISIRRGPMHISEATLATRDAPGRREYMIPNKRWGARGTTNDEFWFRTDFSTGSEVTILRENETFKVAVSGERNLSGGGIGDATAKDLLFDPRDNIVKLGLTLLSHNNFQFWQGLSATPDNPDNIIVKVWFSDGTATDYRGTTRQSQAGADTFFGFVAPEGSAITRLQLRVVGRNFRTFTSIDDIGFITGPSAPYISSGALPSLSVPSAARSRKFVRALEVQRNPDTVSIPGLNDLGLSLDTSTGLITGTVAPDAPDEATLDVVLSSVEGERTEQVSFVFADPELPAVPPPVRFTADVQALATLGRDFSYSLTIDLDGVEEENVEFFAVVRRVTELGDNPIVSLGELGLSLSDNILSGKVVRSSAVGTYEMLLYAMSPEGATGPYPVQLKIVPPTPEPNFDGLFGNLQTDLVLFDPSSGSLSVSLFFTDAGTGEIILEEPVEVASGLPADTRIFYGEFNGDANTDLLTHAPSEGIVRVFAMSGAEATVKVLRNWGPGSAGWRVIGVGDLNVDGIADVIIDNPASEVQYAWLLRPLNLGQIPLLPIIDFSALIFTGDRAGPYELQTIADFNGDGGSDLLWLHLETGEYVITPFNDGQFTGSYGGIESLKRTERTVFSMEEGFEFFDAGDVNGDGLNDILWSNPSSTAIAVWEMESATVPGGLFVSSGSAGGYLFGDADPGPGGFVLGEGCGTPVGRVDLDNDSRVDLIVEDEDDRSLRLVLLDGGRAKDASIDFMEDGTTPRPRQLRREGDGVREFQISASKIMLQNFAVPGEVPLALDADEALADYQIYEQQRDDEGDLVWSYTENAFHAVPVADTSKPLAGRDAFSDGMHAKGEALDFYSLFVRDGVDGEGRPKVLRSSFGVPRQKRADKPKAEEESRDFAWTPMDLALDGSNFVDGVDGVANYDGRGNRGFLQLVDAAGQPVFNGNQPVYRLWRNSEGMAVEEMALLAAIETSIRTVIGGSSAGGAWLSGAQLSPIDYQGDPEGGASPESFLYANRRAVTNAILEAFGLAAPLNDFPALVPLPVDPGAFDPSTDPIAFDVLLTANENAIYAAVRDVVERAVDEVQALAMDRFSTPLFDVDSDPLEVWLSSIESAIVDAVKLFSRDAEGFLSPEPIFTENQLDVAVRRAITRGIAFGIEEAGLVPPALGDGTAFALEPDDIKLFLAGGESSDIEDMKYAMVEALYVASEKLQGIAVGVAVANAVNEAFGSTVQVEDIPIDIVSRTGNVFERLDEATKESAIENAIIVGIESASGVKVSRDDLAYAFVESATAAGKVQAIADAIGRGITVAGGSVPPVEFTWPKDVTTGAGDLFNGYREANSFEQNAAALNQAIAFASNLETGGSLTGSEPAFPEFVYFTNEELVGRVEQVLSLAVDAFGGDPNKIEINDVPVEPADPESVIRDGIRKSVNDAYIRVDLTLPELAFAQGADAATQSSAIREFIALVIRSYFFRSDITPADFPLGYADQDSWAARESRVEEGMRLALAEELPDASFAETAAGIPAALLLYDADSFVALDDPDLVSVVEEEALGEALIAAASLAEGFSPLLDSVAISAASPGAIAESIAGAASSFAFGSLDPTTGLVETVDPGRVRFSIGADSAAEWRSVSRVIVDAANRAFPGTISTSVLDSFGTDPFSGLDFRGRGEVVLQAIAAALSSVSGRLVVAADLESGAYSEEYLLYELDHQRDVEGTYGTIPVPGPGFELIATGDFDNRGGRRDSDLLFHDPSTGAYEIYFMRGVEIVGRMRLGVELSLFQQWQSRNYTFAAPFEGLLEYALGVENVSDPADRPSPVEAFIYSGGLHDGAAVVGFDFRNNDPGLSYQLEGCQDMNAGSWDPVPSILVEETPIPGRPAARHIVRPDEPLPAVRFYRIRFNVDGL